MRKILPLLFVVAGCSHAQGRFTSDVIVALTGDSLQIVTWKTLHEAISGESQPGALGRTPYCIETHGSGECIDEHTPPARRRTERELTSIDVEHVGRFLSRQLGLLVVRHLLEEPDQDRHRGPWLRPRLMRSADGFAFASFP